MEQALTQLDVKILLDDLRITLTYVTLPDLYNLMTTSRSISLYHRSKFKIPKQCKISTAANFFTILAQTFKLHFL